MSGTGWAGNKVSSAPTPAVSPSWWKGGLAANAAHAPTMSLSLPPDNSVAAGAPGSITAPPGAPTGVGAGASPASAEQYVRDNYGYMAGFLDIPEVRNVLLTAAREGWDQNRLYGALTSTGWWQSTSSSARQWQQLVSEDPASAKQQAAAHAATITDQAAKLGISLTGDQIGQLAVDAVKFGWTDAQTTDAVLKNVNWAVAAKGGTLEAGVDSVKQLAGKYLVNVSDATARDWSERIARGEMTPDGVQSMLQAQAKGRYSYMGDLIDQGVAPADYFAPVRSTIANTLEVGEETINMMDPKWLSMLEVRDPKTGELRAATQNEALLKARQNPAWAGTKNFQDTSASFVSQLQSAFAR